MLKIENSLLLLIDVQEKLVKATINGENTAINSSKLYEATKILNIPTIITEQYPKGLGKTVEEIKITDEATVFEKSAFSVLLHENIKEYLTSKIKKQVVVCGIEAHICVLQTVEDLINNGYEVYLVNDAISSRAENNYNTAIEYAKQIGAKIVTTEIVLFQWLKTSKHPNFKEVQNLIK